MRWVFGRNPDSRQSLALFLDGLGRSYVLPFAPAVVESVTSSYHSEVVLWGRLCAVYLTARLLGRVPLPKSDWLIYAVGLAWALSLICFAYSTHVHALYWSRFVAGFAGSFLSKATNVLLDGTPQTDLDRAALGSIHVGGHVSRPWVIGATLGPLLGGVLYQVKGAGVASLALACALLFALPVIAHHKEVVAALAPLCRRAEPKPKPKREEAAARTGFLEEDVDIELGEVPQTTRVAPNVGPGDCPQMFVDLYRGRRDRALKAWQETLKFRQEHRLDTLFERPPLAHFQGIKENYLHCFHGISKRGEVVNYEIARGINLPGLQAHNIGPVDLTDHMQYCNEFLIQKIFGDYEKAKLITLLDAKEVKLMHVTGAIFEFLRISGHRVDSYYPGLVRGIVVLNAPWWFANSWQAVMRMLPDSYKEKVNILGPDFHDELAKRVPREELADEYGGSGGPLGSHFYERKLQETAAKLKAGEPVEELIGLDVPPEERRHGAPAAANTRENGTVSTPRQIQQMPAQKPSLFGLLGFRAKKAHLGDTNRYRFDHATQTWVLEDNGEASQGDQGTSQTPVNFGSPKKRKNGGEPDPEEESLVAAIQAAHFHRRPPPVMDGKNDDFMLYPSAEVVAERVPSDELVNNAALLQRMMIFCICVLYGASCGLQTALEIVVPLWLLTKVNGGGIGLNPEQVGVAGLAAGLFFFLIQYVLPPSITRMWTRAPVRAYRIGCGGIFLTFALLMATPTAFDGEEHKLLTPAFALVLCPLLALLATTLASLRSAASVLLQLCLRAQELPPQQLTFFVGASSEILGALAGGAAFGVTAGRTTSGPLLDSRFFFAVSALGCTGLYLMSLLLHLHVVRDDGEGDRRAGICEDVTEIPATDVRNLFSETVRRTRNAHIRTKSR